ncbi:hypothetical protein ACEPAF_8659 [Sanghuangporus sanghuang]
MTTVPSIDQVVSTATTALSSFFSSAQKHFAQYPVHLLYTGAAAVVLPLALKDYCTYRSLGKGGFTFPIVGWIVSLVLKPFGRETTSAGIYHLDDYKQAWLQAEDLSPRGRCRPKIGKHVIPHRQIEQFPDKKIQELLVKEFKTIAQSNPDLVTIGRSPHENFGDALLVHPKVQSPHEVADASWREIGHIHTNKDYSLHVTLAPQDCRLVIERGWGERHPMSGVIKLPKEYLMIYSPLTEDDVRLVGLILRASVGYMTGSRNVH